MGKLYTADRETGTFICQVESIEEGKQLIEEYEIVDKILLEYKEDFYDIVDENHCSVLRRDAM